MMKNVATSLLRGELFEMCSFPVVTPLLSQPTDPVRDPTHDKSL